MIYVMCLCAWFYAKNEYQDQKVFTRRIAIYTNNNMILIYIQASIAFSRNASYPFRVGERENNSQNKREEGWSISYDTASSRAQQNINGHTDSYFSPEAFCFHLLFNRVFCIRLVSVFVPPSLSQLFLYS